MPARKSFLSQLEKELPEKLNPAATPMPPVRAATAAARPDIVKSTVYIPVEAHERLREIAYTKRCRMHDLLMQGLDLLIEKEGHPERASKRLPS